MKLGLITKRNKKIFESKINKKSYFLRSLPKKKHEVIKKVEEGKTDLIIDKILGLGEFERDYKFFCYQQNRNSTPKNIIINSNTKSSLKNKINFFIQKEKSNRYDNYKMENENEEEFYNSRDNIENNNKYWRPKKLYLSSLPASSSKRYINYNKESFLSKIGNNVINTKSIFDIDRTRKDN